MKHQFFCLAQTTFVSFFKFYNFPSLFFFVTGKKHVTSNSFFSWAYPPSLFSCAYFGQVIFKPFISGRNKKFEIFEKLIFEMVQSFHFLYFSFCKITFTIYLNLFKIKNTWKKELQGRVKIFTASQNHKLSFTFIVSYSVPSILYLINQLHKK